MTSVFNIEKLPELLVHSTPSKPFTMPCIFGKEHGENFMSDWLSFCLDPDLNGIGYEPLNMLLKCAKSNKRIDKNIEYADFESVREVVLDKDSRIDLLIPVYEKKNPEKPKYYIAIENKILAKEGENQTKKYQEHIEKSSPETKGNNIYIFLHNDENQKLTSELFRSVLYKDLIDEFKKIPLNFVSDLRRAFLFNEFIIHVQEHIVNSGYELTQGNCDLISLAGSVIEEYSKDKNNELLERAYTECIKIKDIFYDSLYKAIRENFSNDEELIVRKSRSNIFIQVLKEDWDEFDIHYEIIAMSKKSIPHPDCRFLLMIHCEKSPDCRNRLKKWLDYDSIDSKKFEFNKSFGVYEHVFDTENAFSSPETVSEFIKTVVEELSKLVKDTKTNIDNFVAQERKKVSNK